MSSPLDLYESLDVIGNGSFGIIRKVRRKSDGVVFARKELNFERMTDRDRKQIVAEVNILKDLHHEHIVRYHDRHVDRDAGILYILMEYCGGGDLSSVIKQAQRHNRPIPEDTIWNYFMQILLALNHCHHPHHGRPSSATGTDNDGKERRPQILHRDLKPDNVFLNESNIVKLGDFGLSKALAQASFANTYVGTPYYMSPELMQERAYDSKSDIWSLGCLIYELCALKPPFHEAKTHAELSILIRNGRIPPLPKAYSQSLWSIIKAMLNLNPAMRPSASQLLGHERLEFAFKVSETQKLLNQVKVHKSNLQTKERDVVAREAAITEREARLNALIAEKEARVSAVIAEKEARAGALLTKKDEEIAALRAQIAHAETLVHARIREAVARRDEELRAMVLKQEADVAARMARREEEILEAVRKREEEITQMWVDWEAKTREAMSKAVQERMNWVQERTEELEREQARLDGVKDELEKKVAALEAESAQRGPRKAKTALQEVKNIMASARLAESPERGPSRTLPQQFLLETPTNQSAYTTSPTPLAHALEPPSAMKGVILTATGQPIATPSPAEFAKLFIATPRVRLNFAQVFDYDSEVEDNGDDDDGYETDTRVPPPKREEPKHEEPEEDKTPQPSPTVRPTRLRRPSIIRPSSSCANVDKALSEPTRSKTLNSRRSSAQLKEPPLKAGDPTPSEPARCKSANSRRSSAQLKEPPLKAANPAPSEPTRNKALNSRRSSAQLSDPPLKATTSSSSSSPTASSTASSTVTATAALAPHPPPKYDLSDEENLPSPFIKRIDRDRISRTASAPPPSAANPAPASVSMTFPRNAPRKSGPTLRAVAVVNAANAANATNPPSQRTGRLSLGKTGVKAVSSTSSTQPRSAIIKAQKATEEARKALVRS